VNELALKRDESRCSDRDRVAEVTATERQVAVVCLRPSVDHGAPEVLLIANARTGEWCIPKGLSDHSKRRAMRHRAMRGCKAV
jgi:8-oxo-dGTP pyrophosphatase MutT (NUDIX family)